MPRFSPLMLGVGHGPKTMSIADKASPVQVTPPHFRWPSTLGGILTSCANALPNYCARQKDLARTLVVAQGIGVRSALRDEAYLGDWPGPAPKSQYTGPHMALRFCCQAGSHVITLLVHLSVTGGRRPLWCALANPTLCQMSRMKHNKSCGPSDPVSHVQTPYLKALMTRKSSLSLVCGFIGRPAPPPPPTATRTHKLLSGLQMHMKLNALSIGLLRLAAVRFALTSKQHGGQKHFACTT